MGAVVELDVMVPFLEVVAEPVRKVSVSEPVEVERVALGAMVARPDDRDVVASVRVVEYVW